MKTLFSLPVRRSSELGAFNPALPLDGSLVVADVLRDQFNGLAAMIAAVTSVNAAVIDGVETLLPNEAAYVTLTVTDETLHFLFGIPRGQEGVAGQDGQVGPQGPPFAQAVVDGVTTLPSTDPATVSVSFDGTDVHFSFGIPRGYTGATGAPGEVTTAALNAAINTTSSNSNAVGTLGIVVSDPPTQAEMQQVVNKLDELITALRR